MKIINKTKTCWRDMRRRCYSETCKDYRWYGGRGIKICDRWLYDYNSFLQDMGEKPDGLTLDRINNNGNYEPSNCKWSTRQEQNANRRKRSGNRKKQTKKKNWTSLNYRCPPKKEPKLYEYAGQFKSLTEWCEILEISKAVVRHRLKIGISLENALEWPSGQMPRRLAKRIELGII